MMSKPLTGRTRAVVLFLDRCIVWLSRHWLGLFNTLAGLYVALPLLAPVLVWLNLSLPAEVIYSVYHYLCHQLPERSFFILGNQMAFCERDTALYGAIWLAGLAYGASGRRWRPLSWWGLGLLALPVVVDGSAQWFFPYESNWYLRVSTGILAGIGAIWFLYPRCEGVFKALGRDAAAQIQRAALRDQGLL